MAETRLQNHPDCATVLANFAAFLRKSGRKAEAKEWERKSQTASQIYARDRGIGMTVDASTFKLK